MGEEGVIRNQSLYKWGQWLGGGWGWEEYKNVFNWKYRPTQFGLAGVGYQVKYFFCKQTNKTKSLEFLKHTFRKNQNLKAYK